MPRDNTLTGQNIWQSTGHHRLSNWHNGRTIDPRNQTKLSLNDVDSRVPQNDIQANREMAISISGGPRRSQLNSKNSFYDIRKKINSTFKNDPQLKGRQYLKKHVLDFLNTLEFVDVRRPDDSGNYISALSTEGSFDPHNVDQSKLIEVIDFFGEYLDAPEIMHDQLGTIVDSGKVNLATGRLIFNFLTVDNTRLIDTLDDGDFESLVGFADRGNTHATFCNGKVNRPQVYTHEGPQNDDDDYMKSKRSLYNRAMANPKSTNYDYHPIETPSIDSILNCSQSVPGDLSEGFGLLTKYTPGHLIYKCAELVDMGVFEFTSPDDSSTDQKPRLIIYRDKLPDGIDSDGLLETFLRRLNLDYMDVDFANSSDMTRRREKEAGPEFIES